jgi:Protein of unknown function, DUF481
MRAVEIGRGVNIRACIFSLAVLFSLPVAAQEKTDVIVMKNGDRFTCEIKGLSADVLSIKLDYVDGTIGVQWSRIASLQSNQLFLVQTESGVIYTGKLSITEAAADPPITIQIAEAPKKEVVVPQQKIVSLSQTSESFWKRFNGGVNTGILYSKGNESVQYNLSSQVAYTRSHWSSQASFNSSLTSSSGSNSSTRNQTDLGALRRLRWNQWFTSGSLSFLQSSVQEIHLQTTLAGGGGRYLKDTNRTKITVGGGFGWQNVGYKEYTPNQGLQNIAVGFIATDIKFFKFKKTNLDVSATLVPAISQPGRIQFNTNAAYYIKVFSDLSWNFSFYGSWDSRPPTTFPGSDYGSSSGLTWTFGDR